MHLQDRQRFWPASTHNLEGWVAKDDLLWIGQVFPGDVRNQRRKLSSWTYAKVLSRLEQKAQENRVHLVAVPPAYTSQRCPECGYGDRANRENEIFRCVRCGHADDADISAARNILSDWTGSLESPVEAKSVV